MNRDRVRDHVGSPVTKDARSRLLAGLPVAERRLQLAGISTAVLEAGTGPPVILLHGPGEFAAKWSGIMPELARRHRVVAPDLPAHGASEGADQPLDLERLLAWLGALIDQACDAPPTVVGHTLGGAIAARFVARHRGAVRALALVDTLGLAPFRPSARFALAMAHFMTRPTERTFERFMRQCSFDFDRWRARMAEHWEPLVDYTLERARSSGTKLVGRLMREVGTSPIPPEELERIDVPTILVWGRHDRANRLGIAEVASARYGWPLHVVEGAADDPARDRPAAFLEALEAVLDSGATDEGVAA